MESLNNSLILNQGVYGNKFKSRIVNKNNNPTYVKLAEFERQLEATDRKYKLLKNRLDYMKMVHESCEISPLKPTFNSLNSILMNYSETHDPLNQNFTVKPNSKISLSSDFSLNNNNENQKKIQDQTNKLGKISGEGAPIALDILKKSFNQGNDLNVVNCLTELQEDFTSPPTNANCTKKSELISNISSPRIQQLINNQMGDINKSKKISTTFEHNKVDNINTGRTLKVKGRKTRMRGTISKNINRGRIIMKEIPDIKNNKCQINLLTEIPQLESNKEITVDNIGDYKSTGQMCNDVVEIYHNTAIKNTSPSVVSSKQQFKLDEINHLDPKDKTAVYNKITIDQLQPNIVNLTNKEDGEYEKKLDLFMKKKKNYQQPTVASKLKRISRCSLATRVNLQNIPFVVGTSVTRSHNLGLNIQQVINMMKHRQLAMASDIGPVFIRKIGEDIESAIRPVEQSICNHVNEKMMMSCRQILGQKKKHTDRSKLSNNYGDTTNLTTKITPSHLLKQRENELNMHENHLKEYPSVVDNSDRVKKVLRKLYDEFATMIEKYNNLQVEVEKTNNPSLEKELSELNNALCVEEEIVSVIIDLNKELSMVKQQMKALRRKNSVVCIATHSNEKQSTKICPLISVRRRSHTSHLPQVFDCQKSKTVNGIRQPMAATFLVRLLRQIQSYQQELTAL